MLLHLNRTKKIFFMPEYRGAVGNALGFVCIHSRFDTSWGNLVLVAATHNMWLVQLYASIVGFKKHGVV